jgi:hypothetical protein
LHIIEARGAIGAVLEMSDDPNEIFPFVAKLRHDWISANR